MRRQRILKKKKRKGRGRGTHTQRHTYIHSEREKDKREEEEKERYRQEPNSILGGISTRNTLKGNNEAVFMSCWKDG